MVDLSSHYKEKRRQTFKKKIFYFLGGAIFLIFLLILFFSFQTEIIKKLSLNSGAKFFKGGEPQMIFCKSQDNCYYIDQNGILSDQAPQFSQSPLPIFSASSTQDINLGGQILSGENLNFVLVAIKRLRSLNIQIKDIELGENSQLKIYTREGWRIKLLDNLAPEKVFDNLSALLDQKIKDQRVNLDYIDLRFQNKAFYKFKI